MAKGAHIDKPNVMFPLAPSYNERGGVAFAQTFSNDNDQRKVNCMYQPVPNAATGGSTLYLVKRPGVTAGSNIGAAGQQAYLLEPDNGWVISTSSDVVRASSAATTVPVGAPASTYPRFIDTTSINNAPTTVLQVSNTGVGIVQNVFYTSTSAIDSWTEIATLSTLPLTGKMEHMDGYSFVMTSTSRIYNSDLNTVSSWPASYYLTKQIQQDAGCGLAKFKNHLLAFGTESVEVFYNAGNAGGSPLAPIKQLAAPLGIEPPQLNAGTTHYYAVADERLFFVARVGGTTFSRACYAYDGARFDRVSTPTIDAILSNFIVYSVNRMVFYGVEAVALAIDAPTATTQRWLMFFPRYKEWFEWNSTTFRPANAEASFLGVGAAQQKIYSINANNKWQDDSTDYTMSVQFMLPKDGNHEKFMRWCAVAGDTARSTAVLSVSFSDNDYQGGFGTARDIDMTAAKKAIYRCGSYRTRAVKLSHSGNVQIRLEKFLARIE